jgi:hypothetical protein
MSVIQRRVSIPANDVNENILAGSTFEILQGRSVISMGLTAQVVGLVASILVGSTTVLEESPIYIKANEFPAIPDEMFYNAAGVGNDRIVVRVRNTTGAAIDVRCLVQIARV